MSDRPAHSSFRFSAPLSTGAQASHEVHFSGSGPPILILQELPGIGPQTLELAARLNRAGFSTYLPHLFGPFGREAIAANALRLFCVRREFHLFRRGGQSPVAAWIAALVAEIDSRAGGQGVGVIGMCLTGSFALPLMAEDAVQAAVASQPSLPLLGGSHLHMSAAEITAAKHAMDRKGPALAIRFRDDRLSTRAHMRAVEAAFGDAVQVVEYPGRGHSLLTLDFHAPAYARVERYFRSRFGLETGNPRQGRD
ncbi:dienelactone hydrolase family protein [Lutimaribacter marinistellae]|uniref:Dienelactone hydrolase family protein n=1 Tax=Lutimaribacter marinistellae TaxID=1820329 RepID=A0ABV7TMQ6_9RHOB